MQNLLLIKTRVNARENHCRHEQFKTIMEKRQQTSGCVRCCFFDKKIDCYQLN